MFVLQNRSMSSTTGLSLDYGTTKDGITKMMGGDSDSHDASSIQRDAQSKVDEYQL